MIITILSTIINPRKAYATHAGSSVCPSTAKGNKIAIASKPVPMTRPSFFSSYNSLVKPKPGKYFHLCMR